MLICLKRFLEIWRFLFLSKLFIHFHHVKIVLKSVVHRSINKCFILRFLGHKRNLLFRQKLCFVWCNITSRGGKENVGFICSSVPRESCNIQNVWDYYTWSCFYKYWMLVWIALGLYFWPISSFISSVIVHKSLFTVARNCGYINFCLRIKKR